MIGKFHRNGQFGRLRYRWEHNIKMDVKEIDF
jgi:hypothetical protein